MHVLHDLLLVRLELRTRRLLQRDGETRDGVVVRTTLETREDGEVDLVLEIVHDRVTLLVRTLLALAEENHRAARTAPWRLARPRPPGSQRRYSPQRQPRC